jgi:ribonuclease HII
MRDSLPQLDDLRRLYIEEARPLPRALEDALRGDERPGARAVLEAIERRRRANRAEGQRQRRMLCYEREYWSAGVTLVAGVDEAGMSPLAGPVVAAAVILPIDCRLPGCDDSKKLRPEQRAALAPLIRKCAVAWAVGQASPEEIDAINIYQAGLLAMRRALEGLAPGPAVALIDGRRYPLGRPEKGVEPPLEAPRQVPIVGGDGLSLSIAAASILAKTTRDALMVAYDERYPGYGLAQHKGYPVPGHREAIRRLGLLPIHRRSFEAVRRLVPPAE